MILYHGSHLAVPRPSLAFSRDNVDFGKGFYTTPIKEQAVRWAERFIREKGAGAVSSYTFDEKQVSRHPDLRVLAFDAHSVKWLDFVASCRRGEKADPRFGLIIGGVANDKVFNTLELYFRGEISGRDAIRRLRYNKPSFQYCFKSQSAIDNHLHYLSSEVLP